MRCLMFALSVAGILSHVHAAPLVEAYGAAVGGSGNGGPGCTIYGWPPTASGWKLSALFMPNGGIAPCGYQGTFNISSSPTGSVSETASVTATFFDGGAFIGTGAGSAHFGELMVAATGEMTAYAAPTRLRESAGLAAFVETFTFPGSPGASGFVTFEFDVTGSYNIAPKDTFTSEVVSFLSYKVNNSAIEPIIFNTYGKNNAGPFLPQIPVMDNWVKGGGSLKGGAKYRTAPIPMQFNVPLELSVGLIVRALPCCLGASAEAEFRARLSAIILTDSKGTPVDFTINGGSGTRYTTTGAAIPEPATLLLAAAGLAACFRFAKMRRKA